MFSLFSTRPFIIVSIIYESMILNRSLDLLSDKDLIIEAVSMFIKNMWKIKDESHFQ
jgi:hypothetical protein